MTNQSYPATVPQASAPSYNSVYRQLAEARNEERAAQSNPHVLDDSQSRMRQLALSARARIRQGVRACVLGLALLAAGAEKQSTDQHTYDTYGQVS